MEIASLSNTLDVRKLGTEDVELVYNLMHRHSLFFQYHPPFVTRESILEDITALPPGKDAADKFYIGFFQESRLAALMDLILDYPADGTAYIGLFMVDAERRRKGLGSRIIGDCMAYLRRLGCKRIRIGVDNTKLQ